MDLFLKSSSEIVRLLCDGLKKEGLNQQMT